MGIKQFFKDITGIQAKEDKKEAENLVSSANYVIRECERRMKQVTDTLNTVLDDYQKVQEHVIKNTVVVFREFLKDLPFKRDDREYEVISKLFFDRVVTFSMPETSMNTKERLKTIGFGILFGVFAAGYTASKIRARQLTEAKKYHSKAKEYEAECERQWVLMRGIMRRAEEQKDVLLKLEKKTVEQLEYLRPLVYEFMIDEEYYILVMEKVRTLLKTITGICSTPIFDSDGQLDGTWNTIRSDTRLLLENSL